jgi:hypothetical protein
MLYRHTKRFQAILRAALALVGDEHGGSSIVSIINKAGLGCSKTALHRFKSTNDDHYLMQSQAKADEAIEHLDNKYLNYSDAVRLWEYISKLGLIEAIFMHDSDQKLIKKHDLYANREVANAVLCFYDTHELRNDNFVKSTIENEYFICYKASSRKPGFMLKSRFYISMCKGEYFDIHDHQRSSGRYEMGKTLFEEHVYGVGFIKSRRLWAICRDNNKEQPRIFCFHKPIYSSADSDAKIEGYYGHLMGATQQYGDVFFSKNVILLSKKYDKRLWHAEYGADMNYNDNDHHDIIPYEPERIASYRGGDVIKIPTQIIDYIISGIYS